MCNLISTMSCPADDCALLKCHDPWPWLQAKQQVKSAQAEARRLAAKLKSAQACAIELEGQNYAHGGSGALCSIVCFVGTYYRLHTCTLQTMHNTRVALQSTVEAPIMMGEA